MSIGMSPDSGRPDHSPRRLTIIESIEECHATMAELARIQRNMRRAERERNTANNDARNGSGAIRLAPGQGSND